MSVVPNMNKRTANLKLQLLPHTLHLYGRVSPVVMAPNHPQGWESPLSSQVRLMAAHHYHAMQMWLRELRRRQCQQKLPEEAEQQGEDELLEEQE